MSTEFNFTQNKDDLRSSPFFASGFTFDIETIRDLKTDEQYDYFMIENEDVKKAADDYYEDAGEEGWHGFMEGCKWYSEQLKNKK
jgi:hypothetical protein